MKQIDLSSAPKSFASAYIRCRMRDGYYLRRDLIRADEVVSHVRSCSQCYDEVKISLGAKLGSNKELVDIERIWAANIILGNLQPPPKKRGRPPNGKVPPKHEARAYSLWLLAHVLPLINESGDTIVDLAESVTATVGDLIDAAREIGWDSGLFPMTTENLEQSVSRGRANLQISPDWRSEACEKIFRNLSQVPGTD